MEVEREAGGGEGGASALGRAQRRHGAAQRDALADRVDLGAEAALEPQIVLAALGGHPSGADPARGPVLRARMVDEIERPVIDEARHPCVLLAALVGVEH